MSAAAVFAVYCLKFICIVLHTYEVTVSIGITNKYISAPPSSSLSLLFDNNTRIQHAMKSDIQIKLTQQQLQREVQKWND